MKKLIIIGILIILLLGLTGCEECNITYEQKIQECDALNRTTKFMDDWGTCNDYVCGKMKTESPYDICIKKGGVPVKSTWDGRLKDCVFK